MSAEDILEVFEKLAAYAEPPKAPAATADQNCTKALDALFNNREGVAQRAKEELAKYFPVDNPAYSTRKQELVDKIAHVFSK